jgi:hypothetical protein
MIPRRILLTVVATSVLIAPLCAQQPPGEIFVFLQVKPKPGMVQEFEEAMKGHMSWHREEDDSWAWHVWQFETGEQVGDYLVISPGHRWEDFDAREEFDARDRADAMTRIGPYLDSMTTWYSQLRSEISNWPADISPSFVHVIGHRVKPSKVAEFTHAVERLHNALQQVNWPHHYLWERIIAGGEGPTFNVVLPMNKWADMNPPDRPLVAAVEEALGRREAETLLRTFLEAVEGERREILRYRPDLSYVPAGR